jgi:hypothetical protein
MGEVYRAHDTTLGRSVALKVLPPQCADDSSRLARLKQEALVLATVNPPNVATIYGLVDSDAGPALVLEFVDGVTLPSVSRSGGCRSPKSLVWAGRLRRRRDPADGAGLERAAAGDDALDRTARSPVSGARPEGEAARRRRRAARTGGCRTGIARRYAAG